MGLKEFYYSLEDKYYNFMDKVEAKGLKVYEVFIDPIEKRGIPSFPVFCILALLVLGTLGFGIYSVANGGGPDISNIFGPSGPSKHSTATLSVKVTSSGNLLENVPVQVESTDGYSLTSYTVEGVAVFKNAPTGKSLKITIDQDGYERYGSTTQIDPLKSSDYVEAPLTAKAILAKKQLSFYVHDQDGNPLAGAKVSVRTDAGLRYDLLTNAEGQVSINGANPSDIYHILATKTGFEGTPTTCVGSQEYCDLQLTSTRTDPTPNPDAKGSVSVKVVDKNGNDVSNAEVTLRFSYGDAIDSARTDSFGNARFSDAIDLGTSVYVSVVASGFAPKESETISIGTDSSLNVVLTPSGSNPSPCATPGCGGTDFSRITVHVEDASGNGIPSADVRVFAAGVSGTLASHELESGYTDDEGNFTMDASADTQVLITAVAEGYLPAKTNVLRGGAFTRLTLRKVVIGNHGSLNVSVRSLDGAFVQSAAVTLVDQNGFYLGVARQDTDSNGQAGFSNLPLVPVQALVNYQSQVGKSDLITITVEPKATTVILVPAPAYVSFSAVALGSNQSIPANVTAFRLSDRTEVSSCSSNTTACTLTVPSETRVFLNVTSVNFVPLTTEDFTVPAQQTIPRKVVLLDATLSAQLKITETSVVDFSGTNVTTVNPGRFYTFRVAANLPSNVDVAGIYLRLGTKSSVAEEAAAFVDRSRPADATVLQGPRFNPSPSCGPDIGSDHEFKWASFDFKQFGSKAVSTSLFVRPKASSNDDLVLYYRVYARKAENVIRLPTDDAFGSNDHTDQLDNCYAATFEYPLKIQTGSTVCTDTSCMTAVLYTPTSTVSNNLNVPLGQKFGAKISIRSFSTLANPFLKIDADKPVQITEHDFGSEAGSSTKLSIPAQSLTIPLTFEKETSGNVIFKTVFPSSNAKVTFTFGDDSGTIQTLPRSIVVFGTGTMSASLSTVQIKANQDNTVALTLKTPDNQPLEDAKVTFKETQGSPFDGFPSGSISILGDGTEGNGKDGVYRFLRLRPSSVGEVTLAATRDGFSESDKAVKIVADAPLSFDQDTSLINLACAANNFLQVTNNLASDLKVTGSFSGTSCAKVQVFGAASSSGSSTSVTPTPSASGTVTPTTSFTFTIKAGDKPVRLLVTPAKLQDECVLLLNSETLIGVPAGISDVRFSTACLTPPAPTPTPSPTPLTGDAVCTSVGGVCVLNAQNCPANFVSASSASVVDSEGNPVTLTCNTGKQCCVRVQPTPTPVPTPSPIPPGILCPRPNFGNLMLQQAVDYGLTGQGNQVSALAAPNVLVTDTAGIKVLKTGSGCTSSGNGITCTKNIYPLIPTNAMAFSLVNRLGVATNVLMSPSSNTCFAVREVSGSADLVTSILGAALSTQVSAAAGLQRNQYRTYLLTFNPDNGCVEFRNGQLTLTSKANAGVTIRLQSQTLQGGSTADINFKVTPVNNADQSKFAFPAMPVDSEIVFRGNQGASFEEPAYFGNNVFTTKKLQLVLSGSSLPGKITRDYGELKPATLVIKGDSVDVSGEGAFSGVRPLGSTSVKRTPAPDGLRNYDVVGNVISSGECNGVDYCTPDAEKAYVDGVKSKLDSFYGDYAGQLDAYSMDASMLSPQGQQTISRNAAFEYAQLLQAYQQCLQQACSQFGVLPPVYNAGGLPNPNYPYSGVAPTPLPPNATPAPQPPAECYQITGTLGPGINPYSPYGSSPYGGGYSPYGGASSYAAYSNPYSTYGYNYPQGLPYNAGYATMYNDPQFYAMMQQNPAFAQQFWQTPYGAGLVGSNPLYRSEFQTNQNLQQVGNFQGTEPVMKISHEVNLPVKVAGQTGSNPTIKIYSFRTDINALGKNEWTRIDFVSSLPYAYITPAYSRGGSSGGSSGSSVKSGSSGYPYLRQRAGDANYYELVNWLGTPGSTSGGSTSSGAIPVVGGTPQGPGSTQGAPGPQSSFQGPPTAAVRQDGAVPPVAPAVAVSSAKLEIDNHFFSVDPVDLRTYFRSAAIRFTLTAPDNKEQEVFQAYKVTITNLKGTGSVEASICRENNVPKAKVAGLNCDVVVPSNPKPPWPFVGTKYWLIPLYWASVGTGEEIAVQPTVPEAEAYTIPVYVKFIRDPKATFDNYEFGRVDKSSKAMQKSFNVQFHASDANSEQSLKVNLQGYVCTNDACTSSISSEQLFDLYKKPTVGPS